MSFACSCIPAMVRRYNDQPVFIKMLLPVLNGLPDISNPFIGQFHCFIEFRTVPVQMAHIISVFQIYPGQIGRMGLNDFSCFFGHAFINMAHELPLLIVRVIHRIIFQPIVSIIKGYITSCRKTISHKFGPVIQPAGKDASFFTGVLFFKNPEDAWVMVIGIGNIIIPNIVFIHPGSGEDAVIPYSGDRWRLIISSFYSTYIGSAVATRFCNGLQAVSYTHLTLPTIYSV